MQSVIDVRSDRVWWDDEVDCLHNLLCRGGWKAHEVTTIERNLIDRKHQVLSGLTSPTAVWWTNKIQRELDDRTRLRWDIKDGWTLDRWASGRWCVVGVFGFHHIRLHLIDYLRENDMQRWSSPETYLTYKREKAHKIQVSNDKASTEKILTAVDTLTPDRMKNFLEVESALKNGETVNLRGESRRMFSRIMNRARMPARSKPLDMSRLFKIQMRKGA